MALETSAARQHRRAQMTPGDTGCVTLASPHLQIAPISSTTRTPCAGSTPLVTAGDTQNAHTHLDQHKPRKRHIGWGPNVAQRGLDSAG
jgi:hypothetical protein